MGHSDQLYSQWYYQYRKDKLHHEGAKTAEENNIGVINERTSDLRRKDKRVAAERLITEPGPLIDRNWSFIAWYLSGNWPLLISARELINIQSYKGIVWITFAPSPPDSCNLCNFPNQPGRKENLFSRRVPLCSFRTQWIYFRAILKFINTMFEQSHRCVIVIHRGMLVFQDLNFGFSLQYLTWVRRTRLSEIKVCLASLLEI